MRRFILLSVILGTSIILIMLGGLIDADGSKRRPSQDEWWKKRWTPYEAVYCYPVENPNICFMYVKPEYFNKKSMSKLAQHFSQWFPEIREGVNFQLYDDKRLIESYLRSGMHDTGMISRRRGFYVRAYGRETLVYKTGKKGDEFDDAIRIK